jgi:hypothetical protein
MNYDEFFSDKILPSFISSNAKEIFFEISSLTEGLKKSRKISKHYIVLENFDEVRILERNFNDVDDRRNILKSGSNISGIIFVEIQNDKYVIYFWNIFEKEDSLKTFLYYSKKYRIFENK